MDIPQQTPEPKLTPAVLPPIPAQAPTAQLIPAGFWIRAGAYMIDALVVTLAQALLVVFLVIVGIPMTLARVVGSLLGIIYFVWLPMANSGQTVGKMAAGIAIMRMDGSPLTYLRCLGRWAGYLVSGIVAGMGFVMAAFTNNKRALHDYISDTRVAYVREIGPGRKAAVILVGIVFPLLAAAGILATAAYLKNSGALSKAGESAALSSLMQKADESVTKGNLVALRSALNGYYAAMHQHPADLATLTANGKYLAQIPLAKTPNAHPDSAAVHIYDANVCTGTSVDLSKLQDSGGWGYVADPKALCSGKLFVNCTHNDSEQKPWASY